MKTKILAVLLLAAVSVGAYAVLAVPRTAPNRVAPVIDPSTLAVNEAKATQMLENALAGYNSGDYEVWSRDWSPTMKAAIPAPAFASFRGEALKAYGRYVSLSSVSASQANDRGNARWTAKAKFEKGPVAVIMVLPKNGTQIEGMRVVADE